MHQGDKVAMGGMRTVDAQTQAHQHHHAVKLMLKDSLGLHKHSKIKFRSDTAPVTTVGQAYAVPHSQAAPLPGRPCAPCAHTLPQALCVLSRGSCEVDLLQLTQFESPRFILAIGASAPAAAAPIMVVRSGACVGGRQDHRRPGIQSAPLGLDTCIITGRSKRGSIWAETMRLQVMYDRWLAELGV
jgi:hypothetical protein